MREKRTFRAKMPTTQEAFADCVKEGKAVIVLKNSLLAELDKELNESKSNKETKKVTKVFGKIFFVFGIVDPVMWIFSIASFLMGGILKDEIKKYNVYSGIDVNDANIIVLIHQKDYDPKLDIIKYDETYVKSVSKKPLRGKIKA